MISTWPPQTLREKLVKIRVKHIAHCLLHCQNKYCFLDVFTQSSAPLFKMDERLKWQHVLEAGHPVEIHYFLQWKLPVSLIGPWVRCGQNILLPPNEFMFPLVPHILHFLCLFCCRLLLLNFQTTFSQLASEQFPQIVFFFNHI